MRRRKVAFAAISLILICAVVYWFLPLRHFNFLTGTYTYDPRVDQPSRLIVVNNPDLVLMQALHKQIARDGTYPPGMPTKVTSVEPIRVALELYTDWYPATTVTTIVNYADGTYRTIDFIFAGAGGMGIADFAYANHYAPLGECSEQTPTLSYCEIARDNP